MDGLWLLLRARRGTATGYSVQALPEREAGRGGRRTPPPPTLASVSEMLEVRRKARIEIARLLLEDWPSCVRKAKHGASFPQQRSVTGLASAIKLLRRDNPLGHARLVGAVRWRRLRGLVEHEQAELDAVLGAVVARIPFTLVAPDHVLRAGDWFDPWLDDPPELTEETAVKRRARPRAPRPLAAAAHLSQPLCARRPAAPALAARAIQAHSYDHSRRRQ